MKRAAFLGLFGWPVAAATKLSLDQVRLDGQGAIFKKEIFDLRATPQGSAVSSFRLSGSVVAPTLATLDVFVDGKLLLESLDYSVSGGQIQTSQAYFGVIVQVKYLSA